MNVNMIKLKWECEDEEKKLANTRVSLNDVRDFGMEIWRSYDD